LSAVTRFAAPRVQPAPRLRSARGGFALLITLTMLAFVVLLLVGLASYTRIETAVAGNFQRQAQARQNAQLALDVALAQLQKNSGPDQRVTATAESFGGVNGTRYYTGVWNNEDPAAAPAWLTSGLEAGLVNVTAAPPAAQRVELVGVNTSGLGNANNVVARLMPITTVGVPGQAGATAATIGRYAWWIGDQGVKAPVGLRDTTDGVDYAPFDSAELRSRIRQQISLGAGPANFEPRDAVNALLVPNLKAANQLAFLRAPGGTAVGLAALQANYSAWSANNFNVLADTAGTGLKRDLSIDPSLLGASAQAWLDYTTYMESPDASAISAFPPIPAITPESLRRRYVMQPGPPAISPVLSFFLLSFNVRTLPTPGGNPSATPQPVQVRFRGAVSLWNPAASALVPENLQLEIVGLPRTLRLDNVTTPSDSVVIPFATLFEESGALRLNLPWSVATPSGSLKEDERRSWLPGRTYSWTVEEDVSDRSPTPDGYATRLNSQNISTVSGDGVQRALTGLVIDGSDQGHLETSLKTQLTVNLVAVRSTGNVTLASFTSPEFDAFRTTTRAIGSFTYSPTFVFRLAESEQGPGAWLTANRDLREATVPAEAFVIGTTGSVNGPDPSLYENTTRISAPDRLLDRDVASYDFNEDAPVFELPRGPLLSMGALQQLALPGARPFSVGNSWGATADINGTPAAQLFDRFFFSGLTPAVTPSTEGNALVLPNPLLRVAPRSATGTPTTVDDLRTAPTARSSKFLLQGGAFNVNSTNVAAWAAVLRSVRFPAAAFNYLDADPATGTAADTGETTVTVQSGDAQFFRFSQSAQETYKAESGLAAGAGNTSAANTHLFRQGMITLDADKVTALAAQIVALVRARHAASGPFRSLAEFLSPAPDFLDAAGGQISLLEKAIADAAINVDAAGNPIEFSSQFLTQGDIMTALAPVLFPRSDTFVIRTYGEAVNPATGATEGRAWAEATVQRTPEYFDSTDDATVAPADLNAINQTYGRRFKVVSFRWLTRADL
jgi:Tfp pilus assembly protein PilX